MWFGVCHDFWKKNPAIPSGSISTVPLCLSSLSSSGIPVMHTPFDGGRDRGRRRRKKEKRKDKMRETVR